LKTGDDMGGRETACYAISGTQTTSSTNYHYAMFRKTFNHN